jgi:hypothetical protein
MIFENHILVPGRKEENYMAFSIPNRFYKIIRTTGQTLVINIGHYQYRYQSNAYFSKFNVNFFDDSQSILHFDYNSSEIVPPSNPRYISITLDIYYKDSSKDISFEIHHRAFMHGAFMRLGNVQILQNKYLVFHLYGNTLYIIPIIGMTNPINPVNLL